MPALDKLARVAEVSLTAARRAGSLALSTARQVADMASERRSRSRNQWTARPTDSGPSGSTVPRSAPPPVAAREPNPESTDAPAPIPAVAADPVPAVPDEHVSREAVVVAESADEGAEDGVGAQIRIGEPWQGYGSLTAREVNDRLAAASPESLAVARLYETAHRNRVTVIREIDRRLASGAR